MAEPSVQVPVSLIERAIEDAVQKWWDGDQAPEDQGATYLAKAVKTAVLALLSQPTPSAEPYTPEDGPAPWGYLPTDRIEDMAPGTTFTALVELDFTATTFLGQWVASDPDGHHWVAGDFNPSTIRDVTPPKEHR